MLCCKKRQGQSLPDVTRLISLSRETQEASLAFAASVIRDFQPLSAP
jgi:hypothetical protein